MWSVLQNLLVTLIVVFALREGSCDILAPPRPDLGSWYPNGKCPGGTYIKAIRLKYAYKKGLTAGSGRTSIEVDPVGYSDESGLKFLEIFCSNTGNFDKSALVKSAYSLDDDYSYLTCPGNTYAVSYQLFFTKVLDEHRVAKSNSWYLGPHQFVNNSASSMRLFCGKNDASFPGPEEDFGPRPHKYEACGRNLEKHPDDYDILCKLVTNKEDDSAGKEREMTSTRSFAHSCCSNLDFICKEGYLDLNVVKDCDNSKGKAPIGCPFQRVVGVSYRGPNVYFDEKTVEEAEAQKEIDITAQQKMGLNLNNVGTTIFKKFDYYPSFLSTSLPETESAAMNHGSVTFTVPPGQRSRVRQIYGRCGVYQMNSDLFEVTDFNSSGNQIRQIEDAFPLKPRKST